MKKLVKKIVVAVMAMAMAIGMLTVSASAADFTDLQIAGDFNGWTFESMEKVGDDVFYFEVELGAGASTQFKCSPTGTWGSQINTTGADGADNNIVLTATDAGTYYIVVDASELQDGTAAGFWFSGEAVKLESSVPTGDATPYIAIAAVAVLALGAVVLLASKKKVVTE